VRCVLGGFQYPLVTGIFGDSCDMNFTGTDINEEKNKIQSRSARCPDGLCKKITGPEGLKSPFHVSIPGIFAAFTNGIDTVAFKNIFYSIACKFSDMQFFQFTEDARIAPVIGLGYLNNEFLNLLRGYFGASPLN